MRHLDDLPRYLRAIGRRLDKLPANPARDREWMAAGAARCGPSTTTCSPRCRRAARDADEVREIRWMIEELRVSLFAQELRTPYPVSAVRLYRAMDALR